MSRKLPMLYSLRAIGVATFLGSVLAGGYMLAANYVALGERRFALYTMYGTLAGLAVSLAISASFPFSAPTLIAAVIIPVLIVIFITDRLQGPMFTTFEEMGGTYHPIWRTIYVAVVASIVLLVPALIAGGLSITA